MKTLLTIAALFISALTFAQTDSITEWHTIAYGHRASKDTAYWIAGSWIQINDSMGVQHRKSIKGVIQRREIYYKKD